MRKLPLATLISLVVVLAACGGGAGDDSSASGANDGEGTPFEGIGEAASGTDLLQAGPVTATADPGQAWVEVEGQRMQFSSADSTFSECIINEQQLSVLYQVPGAELRLNGLLLPDGWNLSLNLIPPGQDGVTYGGSLRSGSLGIDGETLSFEGPVDRIEGQDVANASKVDATLAAHCQAQ